MILTKYESWLADVTEETLDRGSVSYGDMKYALEHGHPVLDILTALNAAAETFERKYECTLSTDQVAGPVWLEGAISARSLLNHDLGLIDSGVAESYFWKIINAAGFTEGDVE